MELERLAALAESHSVCSVEDVRVIKVVATSDALANGRYDKPHPLGGAAGRNVNERRSAAMWQHGKTEYERGAAAERERIVARLREVANAFEDQSSKLHDAGLYEIAGVLRRESDEIESGERTHV